MYDILEKSPLFKNLKAKDIEKLFSFINCHINNYTKNEMVAFRNDPCEKLAIILSGSVVGEMLDYSGKAIKVEDIRAPRPLAPAFLFGKKATFPVNIISTDKTSILFIDKIEVIRLFQINSIFLQNYLDIICNKTHFLSEKIWFISFKTIKQKFCHYLLSNIQEGSNSVFIHKSQRELADYFGVARPSLTRVISELSSEGIISSDRKKTFTILDKEQLINLIEN